MLGWMQWLQQVVVSAPGVHASLAYAMANVISHT